MSQLLLRRLTGGLLVITPLGFLSCFFLLSLTFSYPEILQAAPGDILQRFAQGGEGLVLLWYGLTGSALLLIPLAVLSGQTLASEGGDRLLLQLATVSGVVAGTVQTLGFLRWPFLVPSLAHAYLDPQSTEAARAAIVVVFDAFHRYAGQGIGEHLGYFFTAGWTLLISLVLLKQIGRWRLLAWVGIILACGIAAGNLQAAGFAPASSITALAYSLWAVWLIVLGARLLLSPRLIPSPATP
ncbi:MAG: DUF4386 domain-containing protein [Ktedonobacteraceae bacterium]|nr:DUF4386 domain-containing protein [Ktedonobacteraceae bacterium]